MHTESTSDMICAVSSSGWGFDLFEVCSEDCVAVDGDFVLAVRAGVFDQEGS